VYRRPLPSDGQGRTLSATRAAEGRKHIAPAVFSNRRNPIVDGDRYAFVHFSKLNASPTVVSSPRAAAAAMGRCERKKPIRSRLRETDREARAEGGNQKRRHASAQASEDHVVASLPWDDDTLVPTPNSVKYGATAPWKPKCHHQPRTFATIRHTRAENGNPAPHCCRPVECRRRTPPANAWALLEILLPT
jgi:hypothetical protein